MRMIRLILLIYLFIYISMFRGAFSGFLFYKVGGVCAVLSLISIYWISQYLKHDPPFPGHTISRVAQHYP